MIFCTKKSHRKIWDLRCDCKLCVKTGPASLKSMCVNKLGYLLDNGKNKVLHLRNCREISHFI